MLDQLLRKHISTLLKTKPELRKYAQKMSQIKKQVLQESYAETESPEEL